MPESSEEKKKRKSLNHNDKYYLLNLLSALQQIGTVSSNYFRRSKKKNIKNESGVFVCNLISDCNKMMAFFRMRFHSLFLSLNFHFLFNKQTINSSEFLYYFIYRSIYSLVYCIFLISSSPLLLPHFFIICIK